MKALVALGLALLPAVAHAQNDSGLSTGGLEPPPAIENAPTEEAPSDTERELLRAEREDAGRGLSFFWVNGEAGYQFLGLQTFHAGDLVDGALVDASQSGLVVGAGAGVRLIVFTIGARFRLGNFEDYKLWTLNAEVGMRIPLGALEPYFTFGGGYASLGSIDSASVEGLVNAGLDAGQVNVRGVNLRGGVGLDYYLASTLSVGANLSGDLLFLGRSKVASVPGGGAGTPDEAAAAQVYAEDGSSVGGAAALTALVGLHF
ncbi:MAG TPA: hypothetical protein VER33_07620 [Polyangiaceae bacterium]|nr:hypothetical protein [Polyangiaceae bacterium]